MLWNKTILSWITDLGIADGTPSDERKRIRIMNAVRACGIVYLTLIANVQANAGATKAVTISLTAIGMLLLSVAAGCRGAQRTAKHLLILGACATLLTHLFYGTTVFAFLNLFPIVCMITLLYPARSWHSRIGPFLVIFALLAIFKWGDRIVSQVPYPGKAPFLLTLAMNATLVILAVRSLIKENIKSELALVEEKSQLARVNSDLEIARVAAENANKHKDYFMAKMSHELRSPMNGVLGMSQLLMDTPLTREQSEFVKLITNSAEQQLALINNLLDYAKITAGKAALELQPARLPRLIRDTCGPYMAQAAKKGIHFDLQISPDVPDIVATDSVKLTQIIVNLLSNALKFTSQGSISLHVSRTGAATSIKIKDTGIGMTSEQVSKIFTPFHQADDSITRRFGGTGLGMSIVKELTELLGGTILVTSAYGQGTTANIDLPLREIADSTLPDLSGNPIGEGVPVGMRVLLAEDNPTNVIVARHFLEKVKANVTFAENGLEALENYKNGAFDLILMDLHMPVMSGFEAIRKIREHQVACNLLPVPIYILSADLHQSALAECGDLGVAGFIAKPIHREQLYKAMAEAARSGSIASATRAGKPAA